MTVRVVVDSVSTPLLDLLLELFSIEPSKCQEEITSLVPVANDQLAEFVSDELRKISLLCKDFEVQLKLLALFPGLPVHTAQVSLVTRLADRNQCADQLRLLPPMTELNAAIHIQNTLTPSHNGTA